VSQLTSEDTSRAAPCMPCVPERPWCVKSLALCAHERAAQCQTRPAGGDNDNENDFMNLARNWSTCASHASHGGCIHKPPATTHATSLPRPQQCTRPTRSTTAPVHAKDGSGRLAGTSLACQHAHPRNNQWLYLHSPRKCAGLALRSVRAANLEPSRSPLIRRT
jgi:hypothetical protein